MAPALTKFHKDGHGIHLSSPPASSEQSVTGVMDVDSQLRPSEDLQKMVLSVLPSLDPYLQANPLEPPSSTGECGSLVLPSMDSSVKSHNKTLRELRLAPSMLPGASDVCFLPGHNDHHRHKSACRCKPGARDVHLLWSLPNVSPCFVNGDCNSVLPTTSKSNQENCKLDQFVPKVELQNQIKMRVSRQTGLHIRAHKLQRRLESILGQHAVLHCDQQLEGLNAQGQDRRGFSADSGLSLGDGVPHSPWPQTHFTEIKEFTQSSRAVLRGLQETLDPEATASSSSDDEAVETKAPSEYRERCVASSCSERRWLKERAELGSRWSWLRLRVAELDGRIQQLMKLHKNIRSTKGCVVLANTQPITTRQMKSALLKEVAGLSCTALDTDNEPCSPTRLLHNIQRQSAQLSQIVNSLMAPLNLSPHSKPLQPRKDNGAFDSNVFVSGSSKRRKFGVRKSQLFKDDMSCVCARTRPLMTYHKPRLFRLHSVCSYSNSKCSSPLSRLTYCSCSHCSSCSEPVLACSDPDSGSNGTLPSRTSSSNCGDSSLLSLFTKGSAREKWSQIPLVINALPLSPVQYRRHSSPLYNSHKYTHHLKKRILGLSPIRHSGLQNEDRVHPRKRKRRRRNCFTEDEDDALSFCEDSSDEMFGENLVLVSQKQNTTRGAARRRRGESLFDIDNIVLPASLTKVEKLQYKDILTPSWQVLTIQSILKDDPNSEKEEEMEILTDEVFAQRHLPFEQKEKMRWSFWGKRQCRHSFRSGSTLSDSVGELRTSGEDNSVEWSYTQLDTDEQLSLEECLPQAPWERRVFPLNDDEETALSSEVLQWCSDSTCTLSSSTSINSDLITLQ